MFIKLGEIDEKFLNKRLRACVKDFFLGRKRDADLGRSRLLGIRIIK